MSITICIIGLGIIGLSSWYSFLRRMADIAEEKRRLTQKLEKIQSAERSFDNYGNGSTVA